MGNYFSPNAFVVLLQTMTEITYKIDRRTNPNSNMTDF